MSFDPRHDADHDNRREFPRLRSGVACTLLVEGGDVHAEIVDASRGGCKLRFDDPEGASSALLPVPRDVMINCGTLSIIAIVMWASGGLAGCRFLQHLTLDQLAELLPGPCRPAAAPSPSPSAAAEAAEAAEEAELRARIEAEIAALGVAETSD